MKDKASGNNGVDAENSEAEVDDEPGIHVGDEVSLDLEAGDLLDPVEDRWWDEEPEENKPEGVTEEQDEIDSPDEIGSVEEKLNREREPGAENSDEEEKDEMDELLPPVRKKRSFKATPKQAPSLEPVEPAGEKSDDPGIVNLEEPAGEEDLKTGPALVIDPPEEKEPGEDGGVDETNDEEVPSDDGGKGEEPAAAKKVAKVPKIPKIEEKVAPTPVMVRKKKADPVEVGEADEEEPDSETGESGLVPDPVKNDSVSEPKTKKADKSRAEEDQATLEEEKPAIPIDEPEKDGEDGEFDEDDDSGEEKPLLQVLNENQAPVDLASAATSYTSTKPKAGCWTIFATLFFIASLLLLAIVGVGAAIAWSKMGDLEREIDTIAKNKLEQQGIYLDYEGWEWAFPRGLVLKNVTIYESAERSNPAVQASDVGVNVDFVGLARDRDSLSGAELSLDESDISIFDGGNSVVDLQNIDGEILIDREKVRLERFDAEVGGLRVLAVGSVDLPEKNPGNGSGDGGGSSAKSRPFAVDLAPLKAASEFLAVTTEGEKPVLSVDFRGAEGGDGVSIKATLNGRDFTWRGVPITSATAACSFDPTSNLLEFSNFQIGHGEGFIGGVFSVAMAEKRIDIVRAQSSVDLLALYTSLEPDTKEKWKKIAFADAPNVQFSGTVPLETPVGARLSIDYEHRKGLIYKAKRGDLAITGIRGRIDLNDGRLETNDLAADLLGGQVSLNGTVNLGTEGTPFSGLIEISKLPLTNVSAYFGKEDLGMSGDLYMNFRGVGYSDVERIRGGGDIRVEEATLPAFPIVGPVQNMLGQVIPAFSFEEAGAVSGSYLVESGILLTNNFEITNTSANLLVNGSVKLAQQTTDFTAIASLNEPLAKATGLEGKTIEVRGTGPLSEPKLTLRDFPVEFAGKNLNDILGTSPETLGTLSQILAGQDNAAEVITGSIEEATGVELGETVGALLEGLISPAVEGAEPEPTEEPGPDSESPAPEPAKPIIRATVVEPE